MNALSKLLWAGIAVFGAIALAVVALSRGEMINSVWLVVAAICTYLIAYRFYGFVYRPRSDAGGCEPRDARLSP
jgi:carbon starvation protein